MCIRDRGINSGEPAPTGLTAPELLAYNTLSTFFGRNASYGAMMVTRPQTIGYALVDSPSGLAAFTYEKIAEWSDSDGHPERVIGRDEIPVSYTHLDVYKRQASDWSLER